MPNLDSKVLNSIMKFAPGELEERILAKIRKMSDPARDETTGCADYVAGNRRVYHCEGDLHLTEMWEFNHSSELRENSYNLIVVEGKLSFSGEGQIVTHQNLAIRTRDFTADARELLPDRAHILSLAGQDGKPVSSYAGDKAKRGANGKEEGRKGDDGQDSAFLKDNAGHGKEGARGDHGQQGDDGKDGEDGNPGTHGGFLSLVTDRFTNTWLIMTAEGGNGSDGGSGGDGGDGGNGRAGGPGGAGGAASIFGNAGNGGIGGQGGDAGRGGQGGDAGIGGNGGNGGQITVRYTTRFSQPQVPEFFVNPGRGGTTGIAGVGGRTGSPGMGGNPGIGGSGNIFWDDGDPGPTTSKPGNIPRDAVNGITPGFAVDGQPGSWNGGARWAQDPEIWPYSGLLGEDDWEELIRDE
ncbi:hypothetical protein [Thioclava kandeliae]|uniref:Collagen-like protein n=1 Tax=Thioclava kandeliae TaxID=3070818 RepID=A0ABV1SMX7_9RHOB